MSRARIGREGGREGGRKGGVKCSCHEAYFSCGREGGRGEARGT